MFIDVITGIVVIAVSIIIADVVTSFVVKVIIVFVVTVVAITILTSRVKRLLLKCLCPSSLTLEMLLILSDTCANVNKSFIQKSKSFQVS